MRKAWLWLLVALCLVSSQQGALLHELRHYAPPAGALASAEASTHGPGVDCDVCLSFDHIAGVVATAFVILALLATQDFWSLTQRFAIGEAECPHPRARGPPGTF